MIGWLKNIVRGWGCERCEQMHRRAQAAESSAVKAMRQWDYSTAWKTVDYLRRWRERDREKMVLYKWRQRAFADALRARGVDDAEILRLARSAEEARRDQSWRRFEPLPRQSPDCMPRRAGEEGEG